MPSSPEKRREQAARRRASNPEKYREYRRKWQAANPDKQRAYREQFLATHPDYHSEYRRAHGTTKPRPQPREAFLLDPSDPRHGTPNGYSNLKCRCDRCRAAWAKAHAAYMTRYRARKAELGDVENDRAIDQDLRAMANAKRPETVFGIAEAMRGLGRWTNDAQAVYDAKLKAFAKPIL